MSVLKVGDEQIEESIRVRLCENEVEERDRTPMNVGRLEKPVRTRK